MNNQNKIAITPRIRAIQKIYSSEMNPADEIKYSNGQYKKFIKDIVQGTIERKDLIKKIIDKYLNKDINLPRTDKLLKIILYAAIFELMFKHNNPTKVIISEYLKTAEFFLEKAQIKFLNAILDKISKNIRNENI